MVSEAEKYEAGDELTGAHITAENGLESYAYNLWNSINDMKLAGKFDAADRTKLETTVNKAITWLDSLQEVSPLTTLYSPPGTPLGRGLVPFESSTRGSPGTNISSSPLGRASCSI